MQNQLIDYVYKMREKDPVGNSISNRGGWQSKSFSVVNEDDILHLFLINYLSEFLAIKKSVSIKGIKNIVAGDADVLLVPSVETGNALVKMMIYFMGACAAGVVVGGKVPVVITSRSDEAVARLASIAAAVVALD